MKKDTRAGGPSLSQAVAVTSIQPGGGFCIGLELFWDRVRRAYLRALRPGYVARMATLRQGACEDCAHDVIDARDVKFHRPVCGYTFRDEDNAFAWRGRLKLAQTGLAEVVVALFVGAVIMAALIAAAVVTPHWGYWVAAALGGLTWFQAIWFFRDPNRAIPTGDPSAFLSPSDGVVTDIEEIDDPEFPAEKAFRLSIYLSPLDVHLNRNPRDAQVEAVRYFPGRFLTASHYECAVQNEQLWVDLREDNGRLIRLKQISGSMARRLVCWLKEGEAVKAGERYGMIKYGSRADVILAADDPIDLAVKVGDRVYAGTTVLLRFVAEEKT